MSFIKTAFLAFAIAGSTASLQAAELKIAAQTANIPFEFEDQQGKPAGYEIDILTEAAKRMDMTPQISFMPFHMLFSAVQSGRADVAVGSITITPKRLESVAFVQPWYDSQQCVTVTKASGIENLGGLKEKGIAVLTGTVAEAWATSNQKAYELGEIRRYETYMDAMLDVAANRVSAVILDCPTQVYYIKDKPQFKIVERLDTDEHYSAMLGKKNALIEQLNATLDKMKEEGVVNQIHQKWFGESAAAESSTVKSRPIPK